MAIIGCGLALLAVLGLLAVFISGSIVASNNTHRIAVLGRENASLIKRVAHDEYETCVIQARGLPAGHQLAIVMNDIYKLLTVKPTTPAERLAARNTPVDVKVIVHSLTHHLAKYKALESAQPPSRYCTHNH